MEGWAVLSIGLVLVQGERRLASVLLHGLTTVAGKQATGRAWSNLTVRLIGAPLLLLALLGCVLFPELYGIFCEVGWHAYLGLCCCCMGTSILSSTFKMNQREPERHTGFPTG